MKSSKSTQSVAPEKTKKSLIKPINGLLASQFFVKEIQVDKDQMFHVFLTDTKSRIISLPLTPSQITHFFYFNDVLSDEDNFYSTPYEQVLSMICNYGGDVIDITVMGEKYGCPIAALTYQIDNHIDSMTIPASDALIYSIITEMPLNFMDEYINGGD